MRLKAYVGITAVHVMSYNGHDHTENDSCIRMVWEAYLKTKITRFVTERLSWYQNLFLLAYDFEGLPRDQQCVACHDAILIIPNMMFAGTRSLTSSVWHGMNRF